MNRPPSANEVESKFAAILTGETSRGEADRWAAQWVAADSCLDMHPAIWAALQKIFGCDLRHGPELGYLHSDDQIAEWLETFRRDSKS